MWAFYTYPLCKIEFGGKILDRHFPEENWQAIFETGDVYSRYYHISLRIITIHASDRNATQFCDPSRLGKILGRNSKNILLSTLIFGKPNLLKFGALMSIVIDLLNL